MPRSIQSNSQNSQTNLEDINLGSVLDLTTGGDALLDHVQYQLDGIINPALSISTKYTHSVNVLEYVLSCSVSADRYVNQQALQSAQDLIGTCIATHHEYLLTLDEAIQLNIVIIIYQLLNYRTQAFGSGQMRKRRQYEMNEFRFLARIITKNNNSGFTTISPAKSTSPVKVAKSPQESNFHKKRKLKSLSKAEGDSEEASGNKHIQNTLRIITNKWPFFKAQLHVEALEETQILRFFVTLALNRHLNLQVQECADSSLMLRTARLQHSSVDNRLENDSHASAFMLEYSQSTMESSGLLRTIVDVIVEALAKRQTRSAFELWLLLGLLDQACHDHVLNKILVLDISSGAMLPLLITSLESSLLPLMRGLATLDAPAEDAHSAIYTLFPELYRQSSGRAPFDVDIFMSAIKCLITLAAKSEDACKAMTAHGAVPLMLRLMAWCSRSRAAESTTEDQTLSPTETPRERLIFDLGLFGLTLLSTVLENCARDVRNAFIESSFEQEAGSARSSTRVLQFLSDWLVAETKSFMSDLVDTDALSNNKAVCNESSTPTSTTEGALPVAKIIISAHICLLLHIALGENSAREIIAESLPRASFWLPIRILKAFITLQGKTGLFATESIQNAVVALRALERWNGDPDRPQTAVVPAVVASKQTPMKSPAPAVVTTKADPKGKWIRRGRDFVWQDDLQEGDEDTEVEFIGASSSEVTYATKQVTKAAPVASGKSTSIAAKTTPVSPVRSTACLSNNLSNEKIAAKKKSVFDFDEEGDW